MQAEISLRRAARLELEASAQAAENKLKNCVALQKLEVATGKNIESVPFFCLRRRARLSAVLGVIPRFVGTRNVEAKFQCLSLVVP
jgi:hypothetical protein